ncbi:MAG: hypothetical protein R8F63_07870 [Acidimicrobiales bacterium]|nr:hypothetical protein [Acidimicrobiales bacterium]
MAATSRPVRARKAQPRPAATPNRARLRVVRPDERARTVGTISTMVAGFFFAVLFALAGLHAVVVQTQADLDAVNAEIAELEDARVDSLAQLAWAESAAGLAEAAAAAGYVPAADPVNITLVPPGQLTPPATIDPFRPGSAPFTTAPLPGAPEPDGTATK